MNAPSSGSDPGKPAGVDPGEHMNVRDVHAAIWREEAEPGEVFRRTPLVLKHFYFWMIVWFLYYLLTWMGGWKWSEYEASPIIRAHRDHAKATPAPANPAH